MFFYYRKKNFPRAIFDVKTEEILLQFSAPSN